MLSMVIITVETKDKALMHASAMVRVGTWLRTALRKEVRLEVMLSVFLIHRM